MKKLFKMYIAFIFVILIMTLVKFDVYAEFFESGQVVNSHKIWNIKFNSSVQFDKFTPNYIKVVDSSGISKKVTLEISSDKKSIKVIPDSNGYTPGEKYTLKITKGLKNESNKDLKKEFSMDFYIEQGINNGAYSINNLRNRGLVVQDGDWIYYSNLNDNGYIYKMRKDSSIKQLVYRGTGGASNLSIVNDYIYFVEDDPEVEEDAERICRVRKDGTGKIEIIYNNISVANHMQVYEDDIYYSDRFGLYKGSINGGVPKRLLDKVENNSDEVLFTVKDGWIYFWGSNYITGKRTGIYKINTDGSGKQCIVKNYSTENLYVDNVNIDDGYIYYLDTIGRAYKIDFYGKDLQMIGSLDDASNINVFDGYIYYSSGESVYKMKADGSEKDLITDEANINYPYINIVDGQLWYYNSYEELSKVSLKDKGNTESLEEGKTFYIKNINNPSSKIINYASSDMNNDGIKENIILTGDYENHNYTNLKLLVQDSINGEIINYSSLINAVCEDTGNTISLGDFNNDKIDDIKLDLLTNMQRGMHSTYIYSFIDKELKKIFDEGMIPSTGKDFEYELLNNANIKIYDGVNGYYLVDLSKDDAEHYNYLKDVGIEPGLTTYYEGEDSDGDGALELHRNMYLVGISYSDFLCSVKTIYKFNSNTGRWEYKDFVVESEFYPYENLKESNSNKQEDSTEFVDKSAVQDLVEEEGYIYYIKNYWTNTGENSYYLSGSSLYKTSKDLKENRVIAQNPYSKIQMDDGWIYYISMYGVNLHRVKLDGSSDTNLSRYIVKSFSIFGEWIYFCDNMSGIYKMKKDGSDLTQLSFDKGEEIAVYEDWIYYINSKDWTLYRMKVDGTSRESLGENITHGLGVNKDGLYYYVRHREGSSLYRMNLDGTGSKPISDYVIGKYAVYGGFIYFINMNDNAIYRVKVDGTELVKLNDETAVDIIGVSGDLIYYISRDKMDNQHTYRIKKDGGVSQLVD